jgi:glycosyltransferase involved in cell wall biosynthesis
MVFRTSSKPGRIIRLLDMLHTVWTRCNQYDLATIDTFSGPSFFWAELVGMSLRMLRKPYILILHGGNLPAFARRWPGRVRRLLKTAAVVTAPSRYLKEQMKQYRSDILLLPNPIDLQKYRFNLRNPPKPRLVWLRAFHKIYNPSMAVEVVARLVPTYPELCLSMGGGDKGDGSFQYTMKLTERLGISRSVEFSGKVPKEGVPDWLQRGDIFINTTNFDNTPVSVLEAMACGLCVISTDVGGISYLLEDKRTALLVPANDPDAMAAAVDRLLTEPGLPAYLSENGRRLAEQIDWKHIYPLWERLLNSPSDQTVTGF